MQTSWITDFAGQALTTTMGVFSFLLNLLTVLMVTYYISLLRLKMRRSLCQWLGPNTQRRFLLGWTVVQEQISGFLFSRSILAAINATCTVRFPGDYPRAILAAAGVVLRHRVAVRADGRHVYRRRAAGAVRLGVEWPVVRGRCAGVHHRVPADREPDSLAEGLAAHDGTSTHASRSSPYW